MTKELIEALDKFKEKKILVIGDIILDKFSWGNVERINPEQPAAPLIKVFRESFVLGGAANVANNIVSLGAKCTLCGIIGNDSAGKQIEALCKKREIEFKRHYTWNPTLVKQRIMAHGQQVVRVDFGESKLKKINSKIKDSLLTFLKKDIQKYDFIILSDYDKIMFDEEFSKKVIELSNINKIEILVDPKPSNINFFKNCSIISPNKHEAEEITGIKYSKGEDILIKISQALNEKIGVKKVIITCGADGMFSYDCDTKKTLYVKTQARKIADVTGAGDSFAATLTLGLASGLKVQDAAILANYAAGIVVEKLGTATPTIVEIKAKLEK